MRHRFSPVARLAAIAAIIATSSFAAAPARADDEDTNLRRAGDWLQILLPAAAYTGTLIADDKEGRYQYTLSLGTQIIGVSGLKFVAGKLRPKGGGDHSFPSGHTAAAFSGASFLYTRYGPVYGMPAYALAFVTGYSRVDADAHFVDDVLAGGSFGVFSTLLWSTPYKDRYVIQPFATDGGGGIRATIMTGPTATADPAKKSFSIFRPRYRYELAFGPTSMQENIFRAPDNGGLQLDQTADNFRGLNEPLTTAIGTFEVFLDGGHDVMISFLPYERRDQFSLTRSGQFGAVTIPANVQSVAAYRLYDGRLQYDYDIWQPGKWRFELGGGLLYQKTVLQVATETGTINETVDDDAVLPYLYGAAAYRFNAKWNGFADISGTSLGDYQVLDGGVGVRYQASRHWDLGLKARATRRETDVTALYNKFTAVGLLATIGYSF